MALQRRIYQVHAWAGLLLGPALLLICASGTFAVFAPEIDWLFEPAWRTEAQSGPYDWNAIYAGVRERHPNARIHYILGPRHPGFAAQVLAVPPTGEYFNVLVDPYSGQVQATTSYFNVWRFFRSFHRRFFLPNPVGLVTATAIGATLVLSLTTGLLAYRKWWRLGTRVRWRERARVLAGDLHRALGLVAFLVGILIAVSGTWYLVELIQPAATPRATPIEPANSVAQGPRLNRAAAAARQRIDGFRPHQIRFGARNEPMAITGQVPVWPLRDRAVGVMAKPSTGDILSVRRPGDLSGYQVVAHIADPIHFGTWGGLVTQAIWFVTGLALSGGILAGTAVHFLRNRPTPRRPAPRWGRRLGVGFGLAVVLTLGGGYYGYQEYRFWQQDRVRPPIPLWSGRIEGQPLRLFAADTNRDGRVERFIAQGNAQTLPRRTGLALRIRHEERTQRLVFQWAGLHRRTVRLDPPSTLSRLDQSALTLESADSARVIALEMPDRWPSRRHPSVYPVASYVWITIAAFIGLMGAAMGVWAWILRPRDRDGIASCSATGRSSG